jgi:hypothetical protein
MHYCAQLNRFANFRVLNIRANRPVGRYKIKVPKSATALHKITHSLAPQSLFLSLTGWTFICGNRLKVRYALSLALSGWHQGSLWHSNILANCTICCVGLFLYRNFVPELSPDPDKGPGAYLAQLRHGQKLPRYNKGVRSRENY